MSQFFLFRPKVVDVAVPRLDFQGDALDDTQAIALEADDLRRVVGQQAQFLDAQITQDLCPDAVVPEIIFETQLEISLYGIETLVLQRIGLDLVRQPDPSALLMHIDEHAFALAADEIKGETNLIATITALGAEDVAGQTLRMHAHEHSIAGSDLALHQRHILVSVHVITIN